MLVSKKFKVRGEVEAAQIYLRSINNKAASQGRGAYTLKELEAYVKSTHKEYMGFGRGWDRYIDNHLGITASGASLDRVADTLYNDGVPYHFHPDCEDCEGGSIWGAAPGALAMELQGDVDVERHAEDEPDRLLLAEQQRRHGPRLDGRPARRGRVLLRVRREGGGLPGAAAR